MEALTALGGIVISIGIDPGAKGAIVAIDGSNDILYAKELPFIGKVLDCAEVFEVLLSLKSNDSDNTFAVLEAVTVENRAETWCNDTTDTKSFQGPYCRLTGTSAAEVRPGKENDSISIDWFIEYKIGVLHSLAV